MLFPAIPFLSRYLDGTKTARPRRFHCLMVTGRRDIDTLALDDRQEHLAFRGLNQFAVYCQVNHLVGTLLSHVNGIIGADRKAGPALCALVLMDNMQLLFLSGDGVVGAGRNTRQAAGALIVDLILD